MMHMKCNFIEHSRILITTGTERKGSIEKVNLHIVHVNPYTIAYNKLYRIMQFCSVGEGKLIPLGIHPSEIY